MQEHEFILVQDLYEEVEVNGEIDLVLIKKNVKIKWCCRDLDAISSYQQVINEKGNLRTRMTKIVYQGEEMAVLMSYKDMKALLKEKSTIGFK